MNKLYFTSNNNEIYNIINSLGDDIILVINLVELEDQLITLKFKQVWVSSSESRNNRLKIKESVNKLSNEVIIL